MKIGLYIFLMALWYFLVATISYLFLQSGRYFLPERDHQYLRIGYLKDLEETSVVFTIALLFQSIIYWVMVGLLKLRNTKKWIPLITVIVLIALSMSLVQIFSFKSFNYWVMVFSIWLFLQGVIFIIDKVK